MIEYVFVVGAVVAIGILLFGDTSDASKSGLAKALKDKLDLAVGKIK